MSKATHSAGLVGKWGQAEFVSKTQASSRDDSPRKQQQQGNSYKFFPSRMRETATPAVILAPPTPAPVTSRVPAAPSSKVEVVVRLRPNLGREKEQQQQESKVVEADQEKGEVSSRTPLIMPPKLTPTGASSSPFTGEFRSL